MSDSYTNLLYHIVFSTKDRRPLITSEHENQLYDYVGGIIRSVGGICLALNGTEDHLHLLAKLRPDRAVSDVLRDLKANATGWMHDVFPALEHFSWQRGYGAFTVSQSNVREVRRYIAKQKEHRSRGLQFLSTIDPGAYAQAGVPSRASRLGWKSLRCRALRALVSAADCQSRTFLIASPVL